MMKMDTPKTALNINTDFMINEECFSINVTSRSSQILFAKSRFVQDFFQAKNIIFHDFIVA